MFNLDPAKLLVILVIALVVLGPERLPRTARQLGAAWRELTTVREKVTKELQSAVPDLGLPSVPKVSGAVSRFLTDLTRPTAAVGAPPTELGAASAASAEAAAAPARPPVRSDDAGFVFDDPSMN